MTTICLKSWIFQYYGNGKAVLFTYYVYLAHFKLWKHCVLSLWYFGNQPIFQITNVYLTFRKCFWLDSGFFFNCFHWLSAQRTKYVAESLLRETEQYWERATLDCQCWQKFNWAEFHLQCSNVLQLPSSSFCVIVLLRRILRLFQGKNKYAKKEKRSCTKHCRNNKIHFFHHLENFNVLEIFRLEGTS